VGTAQPGGAKDSPADRARPPAGRWTLTLASMAPTGRQERVRGPRPSFSGAPLLRPQSKASPPAALIALDLRLLPQHKKPRLCPLGGLSLRSEAGFPAGDLA
jgi:hypothetical protein